jgi:chromosome segregation ATPase
VVTDDIVTRLRNSVKNIWADYSAATGKWAMEEAADEIERLQEQVRWASDRASEWKLETYELNTEIERLREQNEYLKANVEMLLAEAKAVK